MTSPSREIVVLRPKAYQDALRQSRIKVDGVVCGTIRAAEERTISASPGTHEVQIAIGWTGSPKLATTVLPDERTALVVRPSGGALSAIFRALTRTGYLRLEVL